MKPLNDLAGQRFGTWTVESFHSRRKWQRQSFWKVRCDCGLKQIMTDSQLPIVICSVVLGPEYISRSNLPEFSVWCGMKERCLNPKSTGFKNYGGRGISLCERWLKFENFYADMGPRPKGRLESGQPVYSIDRINNDGHYEPGNCRWTTWDVQANNQRRRKIPPKKDNNEHSA